MEQTECSETSAYKIQTQGNYPKESIQNISHHIKSTASAPTLPTCILSTVNTNDKPTTQSEMVFMKTSNHTLPNYWKWARHTERKLLVGRRMGKKLFILSMTRH